ncbi:MAG: hypothetical protein K6E30_08990 [Lachnospiraceae bacterium]|nr:hypothetical protein [Lachnospiraceae bacterium]
MNEVRNIIIGYQFGEKKSNFCYYDRRSGEPVPVSDRSGTRGAFFATELAYLPEKEQWHFGASAFRYAEQENGFLIGNLYEAVSGAEKIAVGSRFFAPEELLAVFLGESLKLLGMPDLPNHVACMAFTIEKCSPRLVRNFRLALKKMGILPGQYVILDTMAAFYGFVSGQGRRLRSGSIAFVDFREDSIVFDGLIEDARQEEPLTYAAERKIMEAVEEPEYYDVTAANFVGQCLEGGPYTDVILSGDAFTREKFKKTVTEICRGRKAYYVDAPEARGACMAAYMKLNNVPTRRGRYRGAEEMPVTVSMDVLADGKEEEYELISQGSYWYGIEGELKLILDGTDTLFFAVKGPQGRRKEALRLTDLPERPNKATALMLSYFCSDREQLHIEVRDLGFGGFYPGSGLRWSLTISLDPEKAENGENPEKENGSGSGEELPEEELPEEEATAEEPESGDNAAPPEEDSEAGEPAEGGSAAESPEEDLEAGETPDGESVEADPEEAVKAPEENE